MSWFPRTPAGRYQFVVDLLNPRDESGAALPPLISQEDALRFLDMPDLTMPKPTRSLHDREALVVALWDTDADVIAFLDRVSEGDPNRRKRAASTAFQLREPPGSVERAEQRADAIYEHLKKWP